MRPNVENMMRAAVSLQVAAIKFGEDDTEVQADARQAITEMRDAMNAMQANLASMMRASEFRRHGKKSTNAPQLLKQALD